MYLNENKEFKWKKKYISIRICFNYLLIDYKILLKYFIPSCSFIEEVISSGIAMNILVDW